LGKVRGTNPVEIKEFIEKFDLNHDGEIDMEEMRIVFKKVLNKCNYQAQSINPILKELNMI
jgi:Ca2+-binding EF-hand superfamily protein